MALNYYYLFIFSKKRINACFTNWLHGITSMPHYKHVISQRERQVPQFKEAAILCLHMALGVGRRPLTVSLCKYTRHPTRNCLVCKASRDLSSMLTFLTRGLGTLCAPSGGRWPRQSGWGSHGWVGCEPGGWGRWSQGSFCWLRWNRGHPIVCVGGSESNQISTVSRAGFLSEKCYFQVSRWGLSSDHVTGRPLKGRFNQCALQNVETEGWIWKFRGKLLLRNF